MTWTLPLQRRQQETEQLCSDSSLLDSVLQASAAAIVVLDHQGNICFATDRVKQVLGCTPSELVQKSFYASIWNITDLAGKAYLEEQQPFQRMIQTGESISESQYAVQLLNGQQQHISINGVPLKNDAGKITGTVLSLLPVSLPDLECQLQTNGQVLQQTSLVDVIAQHIHRSLNLKTILQTTVNEVKQWLQADRVLIHRIEPGTGGGAIMIEACDPAFPSLLGWQFRDTSSQKNCFFLSDDSTQIQVSDNISQSGLGAACIQLLEAFSVKSQLVIPIFQNTYPAALDYSAPDQQEVTGHLWGTLIVQQCNHIREWQQAEIELLQRLEVQVAVAIQHAELYHRLETLNADLEAQVQQRTLQLRKTMGCEAVLRRITDRVRDTLDERIILKTAVRELTQALNLRSCHASFYNLRSQTATISYEYARVLHSSLVGSVIQMSEFPELYQPLLQKRALQFCPIPLLPLQQQTSVLVCPIADNQGVLGDLWLLHHQNYVFGKQEMQLAQQVANQCTIAIRQARLYKAAQAQVKELEKLNRLKDDFLSTISHELRTPLSNMKMSLQLLEILIKQAFSEISSEASLKTHSEELKENVWHQPISVAILYPKLTQCLHILQEECDQETTLINDFLLLQQIEAGTQPFTPNPIQLQYWLPQVVESFQDDAAERQHHWIIDMSPDLPPLVSDLFILNRTLVELLTNASKFTPRSGEITVKCMHLAAVDRDASQIQIQVANTGITIDAEQLSLIFNQFYRIPTDDPWKYGGTGLGLTLVKKMVNYLGGMISVKSEAGQTEFTIDLPCVRRLRGCP